MPKRGCFSDLEIFFHYLNVPVDEVVELEVVVVLAERVDQRLGDFHPPDVEHELEADQGTTCLNRF